MSLSSLCRLCLYNSNEFIELTLNNPDRLREKIEKFLYIEVMSLRLKYQKFNSLTGFLHFFFLVFFPFQIEDDDPFPKSVCQRCIDRLRQFHDFYLEVAQNQEILQFSAPNVIFDEQQLIIKNEETRPTGSTEVTTEIVEIETIPSTGTEVIQLPSNFNFRENSFVFAVQTTPTELNAIDLDHSTTTILMPGNVVGDETIHSIAENQQNFMEALTMTSNEVIVETEREIDTETSETLVPTKKKRTRRPISVNDETVVSTRPQRKSVKVSGSKKLEKVQKLRPNRRKTKQCEIGMLQQETVDAQMNPIKQVYQTENAQHNEDSDDEEEINDIDADYTVTDNQEQTVIDTDNEKFQGFPKCIIKDSKLIVRGKQLLEMMSQFYRLECDICPSFK